MKRVLLSVLLCLVQTLVVTGCSQKASPNSRRVWVYAWGNAFFTKSGKRCLGAPVKEITSPGVLKAYDKLPKPDAVPPTAAPEPMPNTPWLVVTDPVASPGIAWLIHVDGKTLWRYDIARGYSKKLVLESPNLELVNDAFTKTLVKQLAGKHRSLLEPYETLSSRDPFGKKD